MMNIQALLIVLPCTVAFSLLIVMILQWRSRNRLKLRISSLEEQLQQQAQVEQAHPERFSQDLALAERSHSTPRQHQVQEMPDRYRYISAMARQGMSASQIAAALQIGEAEAIQIVNLSCLKNESRKLNNNCQAVDELNSRQLRR